MAAAKKDKKPKRNVALEGLDYERELSLIGSLAMRLAVAGYQTEKEALATIHARLKADSEKE